MSVMGTMILSFYVIVVDIDELFLATLDNQVPTSVLCNN